MRKFLNTLYVTTPDAYLSLNGETVEILFADESKKQVPLINLESIVSFSYKGASPSLMGKCADNGIQLSFFTPHGRYLASTYMPENGNVLLRRKQYRLADDEEQSLAIAKNFLTGKLYNAKFVLHRCYRDHAMQVDTRKLSDAIEMTDRYMQCLKTAKNADELRGFEGNAATAYFGVFNEMILRNKDTFVFHGRSKRPPLDEVNALLSFAYTLLANDCAAALHSVGLDPFVGFLHTDRPGRASLALDLMEELRSVFADRFVLTLINNRVLNENDFEKQPTGAVLLTDDSRKRFLSEWQKRKQEELVHPYLNEKIQWGLVPFVQALLLARFLRGDTDGYPPFLRK